MTSNSDYARSTSKANAGYGLARVGDIEGAIAKFEVAATLDEMLDLDGLIAEAEEIASAIRD